ncbi:MAG: glycosyltransferase family 2 protein [Lactovum sp.]
MKVNICLSTYNGEDFLSEQIESIQAQSFQDWRLLIRDDASTDKTREIIQDFEALDSRVCWINKGEDKNIGFVASFFELVHYEEADFYFFSDQDDIWERWKLELMLDEAKKYKFEIPTLFYTNYKIVDKNLKILYEGMLRKPLKELRDFLTLNSVNGWTMMINHRLLEYWKSVDSLDFHDWYLAELAATIGQVIYIDHLTGYYRQHDKNKVGIHSSKLKNLSVGLIESWDLIEACRQRASKILKISELEVSKEKQKMLEDFLILGNQKFTRRIFLVLKYRYIRMNWSASIKLHFLLVTNWGYKSWKKKKKKKK